MGKATVFKWLGILMLIIIAAAPLSQSQKSPVFLEDFEGYSSESQIQKAYTIWDDGALLEVSLQNYPDQSDNQAMRVDVISPNPADQNVYGSIYHVLSGSSRNWSDSSALRFRVSNSFEETLLLSFNFKEAYDEYWTVAEQGIFFLQPEEGKLLQADIEYGNIPVEAYYQGWVLLPFYSFSVPEWNTARGDSVMDLAWIESYAISITMGDKYPHSFLIDDIEILPPSDFKILNINGVSSIQVPETGKHHEQYSATLYSPQSQRSEQVKVSWSLVEPYEALILIDENGDLVIPAGAEDMSVIIRATYHTSAATIVEDFPVELTGSAQAAAANMAMAAATATTIPFRPTVSAYEQFSEKFEIWAVENRIIFVILAIAVILLVLFLLTLLQHRLK